MEGLIHQVRRILLEQDGVRDSPMVVAVSGGLDSMVLLHAMARLSKRLGIGIEVAHCHHGIRGRAADLDEDLVRKTAAELRVGFHSTRVDVLRTAEQSGESVEMAARRLRHRFLARTANELGARWISLAHHADDQAELVLMRLFRGAGSEGLAGMPVRSPSPTDDRILLLRPLLGFTRTELEGIASANGIRFREDRSNRDLGILRNRIRHKILPFLCRHLTPAVPRILNRVSEIASAESDFLEQEAVRRSREGGDAGFSKLPLALQRIVVRQRLIEVGQTPDFEVIESLRASWVEPTGPGRSGNSKAGPRVRRGRPPAEAALDLRRAGSVPWRSGRLRWKVSRTQPVLLKGTECLDADRVGKQAVIRGRRAGDVYRPMGMPRPSRLKNLFINRKIPPGERDARLVLQIPDGRIAWVEGMPPGEEFRFDERTRRWLCLWWEPGD